MILKGRNNTRFSYDTGSIGAITEMPTFRSRISALTPTLRGLTVSLLLLAAAPPSLFAGLLADKFGHLAIVLLGAIFFTIGTVLEAGAVNLAMLLMGRSLVGIGEGLYLSNMSVYNCEIAPKARRGTLGAMPQLFVCAGTCAGYFTCYGTIKIQNELQWRFPFIIQVPGGVLLILVCCLLPRSPRWLLRRADSSIVMRNIQKLDLEEEELAEEVYATSDESLTQPEQSLSWNAVVDLFRKQHRLRTALAIGTLGMVQLCGIDGVLYVSLHGFDSRKLLLTLLSSTLPRSSLRQAFQNTRRHLWHPAFPVYLCSQYQSQHS